ncbi:Versiconal hemiacetal acetate reductase [Trametes pubescens]|uniref:Versiconal hemiacetal acetate reductase n=1 Tax=Trametes pubescens TaxID=154538 RepID=A0A1M2W1B9_TRAPU|nr:Versiconal hemiacetal acetate reductase [Trametes pubescens]
MTRLYYSTTGPRYHHVISRVVKNARPALFHKSNTSKIKNFFNVQLCVSAAAVAYACFDRINHSSSLVAATVGIVRSSDIFVEIEEGEIAPPRSDILDVVAEVRNRYESAKNIDGHYVNSASSRHKPEVSKELRLGNSGLNVSRIILGCGSYGSSEWDSWVLGENEAFKHIKFAFDHGITTFDTSNTYSNGLSEVILGKAIKEFKLPRDELVIMTKVGKPVASEVSFNFILQKKKPEDVGIINQYGLTRKHIFDSVKASLARLQLDYIDVLQCERIVSVTELSTEQDGLGHRFDYDAPIEETMQALHEVVKAGYVRYIGMSSCWAYQFQQMQHYAITHNLTPFISMQNHYSLLYREEEREMYPTLKLFGVGSIPWSPLSRGLLTRPLGAESKRGNSDWAINSFKNDATAAIVGCVEEIAKKRGISMAQVAIAWVLSKPGVSAPIVGLTSLANLEDILNGIDLKLTDEEIKRLEEPYKPVVVYGHF